MNEDEEREIQKILKKHSDITVEITELLENEKPDIFKCIKYFSLLDKEGALMEKAKAMGMGWLGLQKLPPRVVIEHNRKEAQTMYKLLRDVSLSELAFRYEFTLQNVSPTIVMYSEPRDTFKFNSRLYKNILTWKDIVYKSTDGHWRATNGKTDAVGAYIDLGGGTKLYYSMFDRDWENQSSSSSGEGAGGSGQEGGGSSENSLEPGRGKGKEQSSEGGPAKRTRSRSQSQRRGTSVVSPEGEPKGSKRRRRGDTRRRDRDTSKGRETLTRRERGRSRTRKSRSNTPRDNSGSGTRASSEQPASEGPSTPQDSPRRDPGEGTSRGREGERPGSGRRNPSEQPTPPTTGGARRRQGSISTSRSNLRGRSGDRSRLGHRVTVGSAGRGGSGLFRRGGRGPGRPSVSGRRRSASRQRNTNRGRSTSRSRGRDSSRGPAEEEDEEREGVPPEKVGSKHTTNPKGSHRRGRVYSLLADAVDPPALCIQGSTEQIKGIRRRLLGDPHYRVQDVTSTFQWLLKGNSHRCLVLFANKRDREHFLNVFNTRAVGVTLFHVDLSAV